MYVKKGRAKLELSKDLNKAIICAYQWQSFLGIFILHLMRLNCIRYKFLNLTY